jgi:putative DNA primase/helicase
LSFEVSSSSDLSRTCGVSLLEQVPGDVGNAHRFLALNKDNVRYCHDMKSWFIWDNRRWLRDEQGCVIGLAKKAMIEFLNQAVAARNSDMEKFAKNSLDASRIRGLLTLAQDEVAIKPREFDNQPDLLVFNNGTIDLSTGAFGTFDRAHRITKLVAHDYQAEAACCLFLQVLTRLMGGEQDWTRAERLVGALQVYFGYSLTGHTSSKVVFMLIGPKDTGKTTILEVFCKLFGEHSALIRIESLMEGASRNLGLRSDLAQLYGARFARTSETEEGKRLAEGQLKAITQGMGSIRAERKFENPFEFPETHKLWIDANHLPVIRGTDSSVWERLITVPFEVVIPEEDKDSQLPEKLLAEAPGILAWAVAGARRWYASERRLPRPLDVHAAMEMYRAEMDTVGRFLEERGVMGASFTVRSSELYSTYRRWAEEGGEHPMTHVAFSKRIKNRPGVTDEHKETGTLFVGVGLRENAKPSTEN